MIRLNQIKIPVSDKISNIDINNIELHKKISKLIKTDAFKIEAIVKASIDARDKNNLFYIFSVDISTNKEKVILEKNINNNNIMLTNEVKYQQPKYDFHKDMLSPVIIGAGPAGYFCALYLARMGLKPIVIERGKAVDERFMDVNSFWNGNDINPNSNVSFGEGGAGTFSDGKLNTGIKDKSGRIGAIIDDFIAFGAPLDIKYLAKPHIGTNELRNVMKNMRLEILKLGGTIHFNSIFFGFDKIADGKYNVCVKSAIDGTISEFNTNCIVLAIGHSSRDTFGLLESKHFDMEPKAFAIGLRIEHPSSLINEAQYGTSKVAKLLPTADYKMTYRSNNGRSVYSFCMCPGGFVVNASSNFNQSVVNGMSNHLRDEDNSNSAIVCNVTPEDFINEGFGDYGVLAGMHFQEKYEALAYKCGNGAIPVSTFKDYKDNKCCEKLLGIKPNIKGNYKLTNLNDCLPDYVNDAIKEAIIAYDKKLKGFANDNSILAGIESRTSSPVRILRDEDYMSNYSGIFPCGEGAGYAGGITSAAVDGIKVSEAVAKYLSAL